MGFMGLNDLLSQYLNSVQEIYQSAEKNPRIFQIIDSYAGKCGQNEDIKHLFCGEKAFWQDDYEKAIQYYLKAKNAPHFQFFCYRASAYLSEKLGEREKGVVYAKKALAMIPCDKATAYILERLSAETNELKDIFKDHSTPSLFLEEEPLTHIPTGKPVPPCPFRKTQIENKLKQFEEAKAKVIEHYQKLLDDREAPKECFLTMLNGWEVPAHPGSALKNVLYSDRLKHAPTGLFLRWNNKGIVINPGRRFLDHFHEASYLVQDVDYVIVTKCNPESYQDLLSIYLLNERLNELCPSRHKIRYYINSKVFQEVSSLLQPQYKEERHMVHPLEIFVDSSDVETLPLDDGIVLKYFSACPEARDSKKRNTLGITLELDKKQAPLKLGYVSGCPWSPLLAPHLEGCQVLLAGVGYTTEDDFKQNKYLSDCLGYHGLLSLLKTLSPEILICLEFSGHKGDLRLELVNQIRHVCHNEKSTASFAGDLGLYLDLQLMQIRCNATKNLFPPQEIFTAQMQDSYSQLQYLSKCCVI